HEIDSGESAEPAFRLGEWTVEPDLLRLTQGDRRHVVGAKVLGVLTALAERPGEMVTKDALVARVWGDGAASDESLTTVIYELRRALGDDARRPRYVGTVRGRGYRLLTAPEPVEVQPLEPSSTPVESNPVGPTPAALRIPLRIPTSPRARRAPAALAAAVGVALVLLISSGPPTLTESAGPADALDGQALGNRSAPSPPASSQRSATPSLASTSAAPPTSPAAGRGPRDAVRSVAVLALEPRGEDPTLFARGLSEHVAIDLSRSEWLEVVPAFSQAYSHGAASRLVSRDVDAVVEGAVRRLGERLWVTVQLIAADGQLLWGGSWERTAADLPALEVELSAEISRRVRSRLGASAIVAEMPEVAEALRLGQHFLDAAQPLEARRFFAFAVERQPTSAPAHAGLADSLLAEAEALPRAERHSTVAEARKAAETALLIEADLPAAHASLGTIALVHEGDWAAAGEHFERAHLDGQAPSSSSRGYASYLSAAGRHDEAIDVLRPALLRSPASVSARLDLVRAFYLARRYEEALAELEALALLAPGDAHAARLRSEVLLVQGEVDAAVKACRRAVALAGGLEEVAATIEIVFAEAGLAGVVRCLREVDGDGLASLYDPLHLARLQAMDGDGAAALALLEQAEREQDQELMWLAVDPAFRGLHHLDGFARLASSAAPGFTPASRG
ncbi:MAG: winged helix-turn-helix domain-containing protein, partial [Acidobacteriota bacterium]